MKLTKEDLMKLSKERIVELLLETQTEQETTPNEAPTPISPWHPYNPPYINPQPYTIGTIPCWAPGGYCSNPQHDCINCPKTTYYGRGTWTTTASSDGTNLGNTFDRGASGNNEKQPLHD